MMTPQKAGVLVGDALAEAVAAHGDKFKSRHEALGVLHEEWAEVCEVIHRDGSDEQLRLEAAQLGAMCIKLLMTVGD